MKSTIKLGFFMFCYIFNLVKQKKKKKEEKSMVLRGGYRRLGFSGLSLAVSRGRPSFWLVSRLLRVPSSASACYPLRFFFQRGYRNVVPLFIWRGWGLAVSIVEEGPISQCWRSWIGIGLIEARLIWGTPPRGTRGGPFRGDSRGNKAETNHLPSHVHRHAFNP